MHIKTEMLRVRKSASQLIYEEKKSPAFTPQAGNLFWQGSAAKAYSNSAFTVELHKEIKHHFIPNLFSLAPVVWV